MEHVGDIRGAATEPINEALRSHQEGAKHWDFRNLAADLHIWAERMTVHFRLELGTPALAVEPLKRAFGHYRIGRNGFGLSDEIAIDRHHARNSPYWHVLGTLLHELLHAWQERHGKMPSRLSFNYHNKEFRQKAAGLGLIVDRAGHTQYAAGETPFLLLLREYGVEVPEIPKLEVLSRPEGSSSLMLYECPCGVKVRVGRSRFNARCLDCNGIFDRKA